MNMKLLITFITSIFLVGGLFADDASNIGQNSKSLKEWAVSHADSEAFSSLKSNILAVLATTENLYESDVAVISGSSDVSIETVAETVSVLTSAKKAIRDVCLALGISYKPCKVFISNDLADLVSFTNSGVVPASLAGENIIVVRPAVSSQDALDAMISFLYEGLGSKSAKKLAEETTEENDEDDFRLSINLVYYDEDLVQHIDLAANPTTVTSGAVKNFKAKGGSNDYIWYLDTNYGSELTGTGDTVTYRASGESRAGTDVLYLNDGFEEVSISITSGFFRTEQDGSGAKGNKSGGCFIRSKARD